jgi:hypothetical protein
MSAADRAVDDRSSTMKRLVSEAPGVSQHGHVNLLNPELKVVKPIYSLAGDDTRLHISVETSKVTTEGVILHAYGQ